MIINCTAFFAEPAFAESDSSVKAFKTTRR